MHSWVFNGTAQRHGRTGTATEHHAAYLIELSKAWATDPHRPVWLQEVGAPAPLVPAEHAAAFTEATVANALDCEDVWGVTWWCSHDVSRSLADFPELEYSLGLLTNDRQVKPAGEAIAGIVADRRGTEYRPAPRTTALVVDTGDDDTAPRRSTCAPGGAFFRRSPGSPRTGPGPPPSSRAGPGTRNTWPPAGSPTSSPRIRSADAHRPRNRTRSHNRTRTQPTTESPSCMTTALWSKRA